MVLVLGRNRRSSLSKMFDWFIALFIAWFLTFAAVVPRVLALTLGTDTIITSILVDTYPVQATIEVCFLALVHV